MKTKTPRHVWLVCVVALFFFAIGGYDYVMANLRDANYFAQLGYDQRQIDYFTHYPLLPWIFWTIGTWASIAAVILLFARSRFAVHTFAVSATSLVILNLVTFGTMNRFEILGARLSVQDIVVTGGIIVLFFYARWLGKQGALRY